MSAEVWYSRNMLKFAQIWLDYYSDRIHSMYDECQRSTMLGIKSACPNRQKRPPKLFSYLPYSMRYKYFFKNHYILFFFSRYTNISTQKSPEIHSPQVNTKIINKSMILVRISSQNHQNIRILVRIFSQNHPKVNNFSKDFQSKLSKSRWF